MEEVFDLEMTPEIVGELSHIALGLRGSSAPPRAGDK
jgi:hypothetical protein